METFSPHALSSHDVLEKLEVTADGLSSKKADTQREKFGANTLPEKKARGIVAVFFHQFLSPFIYILLFATIISLLLHQFHDAIFIAIVLLINATFGTFQEYYAEKSAEALQKRVTSHVKVIRDGKKKEMSSKEVVRGDIVFLESGNKVPADIHLLEQTNCSVDESLLTGESKHVSKDAEMTCDDEAPVAERNNMLFAGTNIVQGRAKGVVVSVGIETQIGNIAKELEKDEKGSETPLVLRMKKFTNRIAIIVFFVICIIFAVESYRGTPIEQVFILSIALAVSAIPEGLPIALTVALSVGMNRMAKRNVIIRKLFAVEALGSCTSICSDKTGTLTINELTVRKIVFVKEGSWNVKGEGITPEGEVLDENDNTIKEDNPLLERIAIASALCNEGILEKKDGEWTPKGDMVDVGLLVLVKKVGKNSEMLNDQYPQKGFMPFESENKFAASLNEVDSEMKVFVKGAPDTIVTMCKKQIKNNNETESIDAKAIDEHVQTLAAEGYRLIALADGTANVRNGEKFSENDLQELTFLALIAMNDPLRPEAKEAVSKCESAGITVSMITGDHPKTALAIAKELGFASKIDQVVSGKDLASKEKESEKAFDALCKKARVFARVDPTQKVNIVRSLQRSSHFTAVTGDGANDAPALRAANVGIAMGKRGTDVARESADLLLTDDNFASIVNGIEEGRVAYSNVRKVIFLLISTAGAEILLFLLSLFFYIPIPLLATQLLWLNVVTNGIQDVALALEPQEGNELDHAPRPRNEPIFNPVMIQRILLAASYMGISSFVFFYSFLSYGFDLATSRNSTLLLMVLFQNVHVFEARSEYLSIFHHSIFRNKILVFGTLLAQGIHILAMYTPWLQKILHVHPVSFQHWLVLLLFALSLLLVMEVEKYIRVQVMGKKRKKAKAAL